MAATQIPLTFRAAPLPTNFRGTPQEFADALVARLSAESANDISFFAAGTVAPTSNVGPWLKNDQTWYVWSDPLATYVPQVIEPESLKYIASSIAPDPTKYIFWIELDGTGKAQAIKHYSGGAWKDVYEDKFLQYMTSSQVTAAIAAAQTTVETNYPVAARHTGAAQSVNVDAAFHVVELQSNYIDVDSVFNTVDSKYVAPVDGIYQVSANMQIDNDTANPATLEFSMKAVVNNTPTANDLVVGVSVPTPSGLRWYPTMSGLVQMASGDELTLQVQANDDDNTELVNVSTAFLFVNLLRRL